ncbi:acyltransferase, partial [Streptomyces sp. NPDC091259]
SAMLAAAVPGSFVGDLAGLTTAPDSPGWIAARLAWMPLFAVLLMGIARYARRFEEPWTRASAVRRTVAGVLAAGFAVFALGLA